MAEVLARRPVRYEPQLIDTQQLGAIMVKSGYFKDTREQAQAIVKILYGAELGFGPVASMLGAYIVEGRPSLSAQLIAAAIQKSGTFDYRVRETTDQRCRIEFLCRGESLGESVFSIEDAQRAGLTKKDNWVHYPKAMLWARAMAQGARMYTPSVFNGAIYTPEELSDADMAAVTVEPVAAPALAEPTKKAEPTLEKLVARYQQLVEQARVRELIPDEDLEQWILPADATRAVVLDMGQRIAELLKLADLVRVGDPLADDLATAIEEAAAKDVVYDDCRVVLPAPRMHVEHALRVLQERLHG